MEYFLMAKGWFRDLLIPMKPTESTPPTTTTTTTTSRKSVISFREIFSSIPLRRFFYPILFLLYFFFLLYCYFLLWLSLPSPRHFIASFDPPLFVLDGLLFSYYCLIGLSLHLSARLLKEVMKPMLKTLGISPKNRGIISVSSKFESGKNREQKPLVDFDSTNNRACQSGLLVSNSDKTNAREASKGPCMTEGVPSLVDSTTRISSTDFDAPENGACLVRANQSGPIMLNSEKKHTSEGLIGECFTESVLSLDDSTKRKSFPDFDAAENKAHLVRPYQSGPVVSLSENKNEGEALKKDLQQHCGGRSDAAAKSFRAICDPGLHVTDSLTWKSFKVRETLRPREQQSNATNTDQERQIQTQMCNELSDARGGRPDAAAKSFCAVYDPGFHTPYSVARKSFEVLETLPARKQPNDGVPLLLPGRLTLEGCVQQEKSPDLTRVMQFNGVEQRVTKMPRYLGGLTAQSASSSCGPIGLPNGGHIVLLDELDQSTKNIEHVATADQCSPTLSLPEKKMVRKTLNRNCRTMSVIFEEKHQRFVRRCEGATKSLGAMCISRKHGINQVSMVEPIHKQRGIHQWPFLRSAVGLPDGGHILSLLEKKIVRKTLKRKCRSISVLSLEDHKQHVDRRWEDAAKSHGTKRFRMQLVIHRLSTAKCTHKQHGIHQWPFQRSAIGLSDGGHILSLSEKKIVRKTLKRKCRSISVLSLVDRQRHVDRRWEDAAKNIGAKRICRQLVIHRVSIAKRVCRQHGIHHRWPFERDWATKKGYSLGDERPVEVISLSTHVELVSRLQLIYISWLGRFSPRPSALPRGILIVGPIALSSSEFAATNNLAQRGGQDQRGSGASGSENERTREQEDPRQDQRGSGASGSGNERTRKQKDPKEIRNTSITKTKDDLLPLQGRMTKKEAAAYLGVSESTVKRIWKDCNMGEWDNGRRKVWKPPDQYGEGNTSTARETPSHHVQTGMGDEPVGQNQEANVLRQDFMGGPIALNIESGLIMVARPPDQDGEKNTSTACEVPSHNVETGMEIEPVGQNQEANVFRRDFTEDPTALNTENGLIIGIVKTPPFHDSYPGNYPIDYKESENTGSSSEWASQVNDQSTTPYQNHNALLFPQPQVTSMLSENRGGSIDWRNSFASQTEPFSDTHISGSSNLAFPTWSDQAALSHHAEGQSVLSTVYPHHNAVHRFPEVWRPPDQLEGQTMQFTAHPNPNAPGLPQFQIASSQVLSANEAAPSQPVATILTERQDPRSVMVKATYGNGNRMIKFPLPLTSGIKELMQEVSKTLDWELGSFDVYFEDGDRDWVLMARDDNVRDYQQLQLLNSLVNQATKLEVCKKVPDTTNICETCGSLKQQRP